jgi:hypothetical protein
VCVCVCVCALCTCAEVWCPNISSPSQHVHCCMRRRRSSLLWQLLSLLCLCLEPTCPSPLRSSPSLLCADFYIPELVFGHLLTGSNFDDTKRQVTGGRHGYGAKLTNIFSTRFTVEAVDSSAGLKYTQVCLCARGHRAAAALAAPPLLP